MRNYLKWGDYNAICDSCGRKFKASMMQKRWDGLFVCKDDWEIKHPQLSLKVHGDKQFVPIPRPQPVQDTYITGQPLETEASTIVPPNTIYLTAEDLTPLFTESNG